MVQAAGLASHHNISQRYMLEHKEWTRAESLYPDRHRLSNIRNRISQLDRWPLQHLELSEQFSDPTSLITVKPPRSHLNKVSGLRDQVRSNGIRQLLATKRLGQVVAHAAIHRASLMFRRDIRTEGDNGNGR